MAQDLTLSVIGICSCDPDNPKTYGTGFLVPEEVPTSDPTLAVTCAHVINAADPDGSGVVAVYALCQNGARITTRVLVQGYSPVKENDLAFLRLENAPIGTQPVVLASAKRSPGNDYATLGLATGPAVWMNAINKILGWTHTASGGYDRLELAGSGVQRGMSGGPILDLTFDRVVGVISEGKDYEFTRNILAIPVDTLKRAYPALRVDENTWTGWRYFFKQNRQILIIQALLLVILLSALLGGLVWNGFGPLFVQNKSLVELDRTPAGPVGFLWGFLMILPVAAFVLPTIQAALPFLRIDSLDLKRSTQKLALFGGLYALLTGLGSWVFYNLSLREWVEAAQLSYPVQEGLIAAAWSVIISGISAIPFLALRRPLRMEGVFSAKSLLSQIGFAYVLTACGVFITVFLQLPAADVTLLRGAIDGFLLRLGLALGLILAVAINPERDR